MNFKYLNKVLRTKILGEINGHLTLNSVNVPVYDRVPKAIEFPFVVIQVSDENDSERCKDSYVHKSTVTINVITGFDGNYGGQSDADDITDQITQILFNTSGTYFSLGNDFDIITSNVSSIQVIESQTDTYYIVQESIVVIYLVDQLT